MSTPVDEVRRSRLGTALLESRLLTSDEVAQASASEEGLAAWIRRQRLLPEPLLAQAERGEPLRLGRYVVTGRLGKGGMGAVLRAHDDRLGREVAIKVLRPIEGSAEDTDALRARFRREALALARLDHPGIVRVFDLDTLPDAGAPGVMLLVLELVEGRSVEERLRGAGPLPERDARRMLRQVAQAMIAAEAQGIVHRDLKPGNVLWVPEGDLYKVCDFGLVRFEDGPRATPAPGGTITQAFTVIGTPFYMSPEQVLARPLDARSDIYSLGLAMHEVLTGKVPFEGAKIDQVLRRRLHEDVPDVRGAAPHVSASLARVLGWMTQRDAARRPASWKALAAELGALDPGSERLRRADSGERTRRSSGERTRPASGERGRAAASPPPSIGGASGVPVEALVVLALALGAVAGALAALLGT